MDKLVNESGWRGSPEVWLNAAYELLLESGVDSVKIVPLANNLKLSRTSFYWFFEDREALLNALLARWREKNTGNFVQRTNAYAETLSEAIFNVSDLWFDDALFDAKFEFAVRSWALQSPQVLAELQEADLTRLAALRAMFTKYGHNELSADVRARAMYLTQIGYISMQTKEDLAVRMTRVSQYTEVFSGVRPEKKDTDRFFARHNFDPAILSIVAK